MTAHVDPGATLATADGGMASLKGLPIVNVGSVTSHAQSKVQDNVITAEATSTVTGIVIGENLPVPGLPIPANVPVLSIDSVVTTARAVSDGDQQVVPSGGSTVGGVKVLGMPATRDDKGRHVGELTGAGRERHRPRPRAARRRPGRRPRLRDEATVGRGAGRGARRLGLSERREVNVSATAPPTAPESGEESRRARAVARVVRLREGVRGLGRSRDMGQRLERGLLIAGSVLLPLGVILILLGWYGASHTPWLFEQIPYALSGGILGLGLIFAGGFLYFGYWLTRVVKENRRQTELLVDALSRLEVMMGGTGNGAGPRADGMLVATAT